MKWTFFSRWLLQVLALKRGYTGCKFTWSCLKPTQGSIQRIFLTLFLAIQSFLVLKGKLLTCINRNPTGALLSSLIFTWSIGLLVYISWSWINSMYIKFSVASLCIVFFHSFENYHNLSFSEQFPLFKKAHNNPNISLQHSKKCKENLNGRVLGRKQHLENDKPEEVWGKGLCWSGTSHWLAAAVTEADSFCMFQTLHCISNVAKTTTSILYI